MKTLHEQVCTWKRQSKDCGPQAHLLGACAACAVAVAVVVCVVRGWRGNEKSRQLPLLRPVRRSGASAVLATLVGCCSLQLPEQAHCVGSSCHTCDRGPNGVTSS